MDGQVFLHDSRADHDTAVCHPNSPTSISLSAGKGPSGHIVRPIGGAVVSSTLSTLVTTMVQSCHNFDKVGILGGHSRAEFGDGELIPITRSHNGRASTRFGDEEIPVREILIPAINDFLSNGSRCWNLRGYYSHNNLSAASSPGETEPDQFEDEGARAHWVLLPGRSMIFRNVRSSLPTIPHTVSHMPR